MSNISRLWGNLRVFFVRIATCRHGGRISWSFASQNSVRSNCATGVFPGVFASRKLPTQIAQRFASARDRRGAKQPRCEAPGPERGKRSLPSRSPGKPGFLLRCVQQKMRPNYKTESTGSIAAEGLGGVQFYEFFAVRDAGFVVDD
jgi:hypothetical protein